MDPKFLRDEAVRFRGMAEAQDREASKLRFLKMADDYEAKADAADELTKPSSSRTTSDRVGKRIAPGQDEIV